MFPLAARPNLRRGAVAAVMALLLSVPGTMAAANSLSLSFNARPAPEARGLDTATAPRAIRRDTRSDADIRQIGRNHTAQVRQSGGNNRAIIRQRGSDHTANLEQHGGNNSQIIVQLGKGAHADVQQSGNQSGVLIQFAR